MATQVILLGTGTPNACPDASGPATAIIVNNKPYLFDCGPGIIRQEDKMEIKRDLVLLAYFLKLSIKFIVY